MGNYDYKEEIKNTRVGCLGSSDGALLAQVDTNGCVTKSMWKRLAIVKGLIENKELPKTKAMAFGDFVEQNIYENLAQGNDKYGSNPLWTSAKYSRRNVKLISHPDIVFEDEAKRTIYVYEVKATKFSVEETKQTYRAQLYIHFLLANERAQELGKSWRVKLFLVHYDTNGLDLEEEWEFDTDRITLSDCRYMRGKMFDVSKAMDLVDSFLDKFDAYYEGDEIDANYLPQQVKQEFELVTNALREIKEREKMVDDFKTKLYEFMKAKDIKSITNEAFSISRIDPTETKSFDYKSFLEDYTREHPTKARRLQLQYQKISKRKGYASIKIK